MRIFLTAFLLSCFGWMVNAQYDIQILLVNESIGYPTGDPYNNFPPVSNDPGLNAIFNTFNASHYYNGYNNVPGWDNRTHYVGCDTCDVAAFQQALNDYSPVIEKTFQTEGIYSANELILELVDPSNGINTGNTTSAGVIITNNAALNIIFEDFTVLYYEQFGSYFDLGCDCLAVELLAALEAQTDIIATVERLGVYPLLEVPEHNKTEISLVPNPVNDTILLQSYYEIVELRLYTVSGQLLLIAKTIEKLNEKLPVLDAGSYLLNITTIEGYHQTIPMLKK